MKKILSLFLCIILANTGCSTLTENADGIIGVGSAAAGFAGGSFGGPNGAVLGYDLGSLGFGFLKHLDNGNKKREF